MSNTKQADNEIHEDQLLNFLVNTLDEEVSLGLGANAEIDAKAIYEVLVGSTADGTSVSTLCNSSGERLLEGEVAVEECGRQIL